MEPWEILTTDEYDEWFLALTEPEMISVETIVNLLEIKGPQLARPHADSIAGSDISNLKELRIQHAGKPYRVFYVFDPRQRGILLCGGRKDGKKTKTFYKRMIAIAQQEYQTHLNDE